MKQKIKRLTKRKKVDSVEHIEHAAENAPRITNETVASHREEVLSTARKYILPLQHSKHQVVIISGILFAVAVISFFTYCALALYRFHSSNTFIYRVTQVIPFPVARAGGHFVAYENYLFDVRRYQHYYENQQKTDFSDPNSQEQLKTYQQTALNDVIAQAYVKQIADEKNISVSNQEVDNLIAIVKKENRLGSNDKGFEQVLKDYYGWSVNDFRRSLKNELLAQKVSAALDTTAQGRANQAYAELKAGKDFAEVAKAYSDDENTKPNGGEYGVPIDQSTPSINPQTTDALFKLKAGEYSGIISAGNGLEIVKVIEVNGTKVRAAHIFFKFEDINKHIDAKKAKTKTSLYIKLPK